MCTLFGHRGNKRYKENTMDAFINCSYEGIEVDARLTFDYKIVIHHDETFERIYHSFHFIRNMYLADIKNRFPSVLELKDVLDFCKLNNKKLIVDIKEEICTDIVFIIESCVLYSKQINYDIENIIFLSWKDIIKPLKNITFIRVISEDTISSNYIFTLKNELLFDGICLNYTGTKENINCINKIKSKNMLVNIYTDKNIHDIDLKSIEPIIITL
jgi:glycerophosphoryl diester phosphodiesterase